MQLLPLSEGSLGIREYPERAFGNAGDLNPRNHRVATATDMFFSGETPPPTATNHERWYTMDRNRRTAPAAPTRVVDELQTADSRPMQDEQATDTSDDVEQQAETD